VTDAFSVHTQLAVLAKETRLQDIGKDGVSKSLSLPLTNKELAQLNELRTKT
jgi:hypothetical protein